MSAYDSKEWSSYYTGMFSDRNFSKQWKMFNKSLQVSKSKSWRARYISFQLDLLLTNFNVHHPTCSILIRDFNTNVQNSVVVISKIRRLLNWIISQHQQDTNQLIGKPTRFINESSLCIDLVFFSNASRTPNCGVEPSICEKWHHNICRTLGTSHLFHHQINEKIANVQILK